ncbi:MAG TPA: PAS domain-containing protein [Burkholderiales bacterium]|nr:PAS domain-containing protein [Burkholderiales bacterium]
MAAAACWIVFEVLIARPLTHEIASASRIAAGVPAPPYGAELGSLSRALAAIEARLQSSEAALQAEIESRKTAQAERQELEQHYVLAVRGANDGLWEWNLKTGEALYSPRWKSMLGYTDREIGTDSDEWKNRMHPDDAAATMAALEAHLDGREPRFQAEHRLRHKDGHWIWVLARGTALRSAVGKPYRFVGLNTDISEIKRAQQTLVGIAEGIAEARGSTFFRTLVRNFATVLGVHRAFITQCADYPPTQVRTLAYWVGDDYVDNKQFALAGTACEEVIHEGAIKFHPRGVSALFPADAKLDEESYLGMPIFDSSGAVIGHIALFDRKPMPDNFLVEPVFKIFAVRAGSEMERLWMETALAEYEGQGRVSVPAVRAKAAWKA